MQLNIATTWLPTYKQVTVFKFLTDSTTEFLVASVLSEVVKVRAEGLWIPFTYSLDLNSVFNLPTLAI